MAAGMILLSAFVVFTFLIMNVDVQPKGQNGTNIGFAANNTIVSDTLLKTILGTISPNINSARVREADAIVRAAA